MDLPSLTYNGLVIVGKCTKCKFFIWGKGEKKTEHVYCGIVRPNEN